VYEGSTVRASVQFAGLAPGASAAMSYDGSPGVPCSGGTWSAVADSSNVVPESNEGNNTRTNFDDVIIC
jgi:subtilase family serine protease